MDINIRKEEKADYQAVFNLVRQAFENNEYSDHQEHFLVERLRNSDAFIPELSLVAELNGQIVGYILLTKIKVVNNDAQFGSLALAPVAVLPDYQTKGIGGRLIKAAHARAKELNYGSIILLGHANYYPKFGYKLLSGYGIELPFDVSEENCMAVELTVGALKGVSGMVEYPKEFFE